jgi:hypothetical protein
MTNRGTLVTIFGGSGFLDRHIVRIRRGAPSYLGRFLSKPGQIEAFRADVQLPHSGELTGPFSHT